jgi:hypothetical protein
MLPMRVFESVEAIYSYTSIPHANRSSTRSYSVERRNPFPERGRAKQRGPSEGVSTGSFASRPMHDSVKFCCPL